ncbi:MAG: hydroxymethylpyrimidine/phosphomethylpyrimidine kinase [Gammaproteobacteria bacterium]|nr:hydroxymethylpyrimidine/phosphomethylpyrimidine kinase [Gammaproteobacteria bacterium]NNM01074.1 hydroxymethylpyrimidine/phosphomethylpyrimidine kinase [Gammaproteobacteria bacterium]
MSDPSLRPILCIGGHDPCGGAGIQADIETALAFDALAVTAVTALTVQNTCEVVSINPVDDRLILEQLEYLLNDVRPSAIKTGLLPTASCAAAIAAELGKLTDLPLVVDPVLRAGSGASLTEDGLARVLMTTVIPHATVVTPNRDELLALAAVDEPDQAAAVLLDNGAEHVLLTQADAGASIIENVLYSPGKRRTWQWQRVPGRFHGTGCTLATALACGLAAGLEPEVAAERAQAFTDAAVRGARSVGACQQHPRRAAPAGSRR